MDDETRRYLTEKVLGECFSPGLVSKPYNFEDNVYSNRTFDNRDDMMDLYQAIKKKGKGYDAYSYFRNRYLLSNSHECICDCCDDFIDWLFCLSGKGYEDRFQMVADFWREGK